MLSVAQGLVKQSVKRRVASARVAQAASRSARHQTTQAAPPLAASQLTEAGPSLFRPQTGHIRSTEPLVLAKSYQLSRYNSRLDGHADDGNVAACLKVCRQIQDEGIAPNTATYNALLRALSRHSYYDEAMAFYEEMVATGVWPNTETFTHLLRAAQNSEDRCVDYILDLMRQEGVPMDSAILNELVYRHAKREEVEMCIQRLDDAFTLEIPVQLETVEAVVVLASEKGNARLAFEIANSFEANSTRRLGGKTWVNVLISSAQSLFKEGTEAAWERVVKEHQITPDEGACIAVLNCAARNGLPQLAGDVIAQLFSVGVKPEEHHFAALVEAFATSGTILEALAALSWMRSHKVLPTARTAAPILERISTSIEKTDDAFNLLYDLHADGRVVDIVAMNVVVAAAVRQGDLGRAVGIYKSAGDWNLQPDTSTFNILLEGCRTQKRFDLPERILTEMQELGVKPDSQTFETLIRISLLPDQYEDAFFYLSEMEKAKMVPSQEVYEAIVRKCVVHHDTRHVLALQEMKEHGYEVSPMLQTFIDTKGKEPVKRARAPKPSSLLDSVPGERAGRS